MSNSTSPATPLFTPVHEMYRIESRIPALPAGEPALLFARDLAGAKIAVATMGGRGFCSVKIWVGDSYKPLRI